MTKSALISYSVGRIAIYTMSLPLLSFAFCIIFSLVYNFKDATETHCKVANLLPSISAAIGNFAPQKYVWRAGIGIHSAPRFIYVWMYRSVHQNDLSRRWSSLATVAFALSIVENGSLLGLTMVSSSENYPVHEKCFITFLLTSVLYMCLCAFVIPSLQRRRGPFHQRSLSIKRRACWTTLVSSVVCALTFYRHNSHCEPYMYTIFACAEYLIVLSNIAFHGTAYLDFYGATIVVGNGGGGDDDTVGLLKRTAAS